MVTKNFYAASVQVLAHDRWLGGKNLTIFD
jgi:hypothetical protein